MKIASYFLFLLVPDSGNTILLLSNKLNPIWPNETNVTLTCSVELNADIIVESDLSILKMDVQIFRNGHPLTLLVTLSQVNHITFTYTTFRRNDSGNYTCIATVTPHENSTHLTGNITITSSIDLSTGEQSICLKYHQLK